MEQQQQHSKQPTWCQQKERKKANLNLPTKLHLAKREKGNHYKTIETHTHIWLAFFSSLLGRVSHFFSSLRLWHWRALLCFQSSFGSCFLACLHSIEHFSFRLYTDFPQRDYRVWLFYYFTNFFLSSPWSFSISLRLMHRHSLSLTHFARHRPFVFESEKEGKKEKNSARITCVCTAQSQREINFPLPSTAVKAAALFSADANFFSFSPLSLSSFSRKPFYHSFINNKQQKHFFFPIQSFSYSINLQQQHLHSVQANEGLYLIKVSVSLTFSPSCTHTATQVTLFN